jgi:7-cyano-7-deazaguanine reductase
MTTMNDIASKSLGSSASYAVYTDKFDPTLLNPMPRELARDNWHITGNEFVGYDVWHCYEASFLTNSGCPVAGTLKLVYGAETPFMVESKSIKLYMNSFDMCKMGSTVAEATYNYETQIAKDLTECVGGKVDVKFYDSREFAYTDKVDLLDTFADVAELIPTLGSERFTDYNGTLSHITMSAGAGKQRIFTNALRSRCRHTKQKDTGLAMIEHSSAHHQVDPLSMFKQIVSLREVNEFHEFCAEKLYVELQKVSKPEDRIVVTLLYSRRGSLDINPIRATNYESLKDYAALIDVNRLTKKVQGQ